MLGEKYGDCENWKPFIPIINKDIKYLEIGVYYGHNFLSVLHTYCTDKNSNYNLISFLYYFLGSHIM